jgi:selenocysteine-specific translation elongation factor
MFFGLFKTKARLVKVKKKSKTKKVKKVTKFKKDAKPLKKTRAKRATSKIKKRKPATKKITRPTKTTPEPIGKVTHYFPHVKAGVILLTNGTVALGDILHIKGHTTDFKQKVNSMQINNTPIKEAKVGQEIGLLVKSRVRANDVVYKL